MRNSGWSFWFVVAFLITHAVASNAQQPKKMFRVGLLSGGSLAPSSSPASIEQGLFRLGYVEGQNIAFDRRFASGQMDRLPALAAELAQLPLDVIVALSYPAVLAVKQATSTIPIVMLGAGDPVATGLVASFARPGGNLTGVSALETELSGKRIDLLKESFPKLASVAVLWNSADRGMTLKFAELERAAQGLRILVHALAVREPKDFDVAFAALTKKRADSLFVITDPLINGNRKQLLDLAIKNRFPAMYENSSYVDDGGLMSYGPLQSETLEIALRHVDKILKGTKPSDIPIEQPMRFDFSVNLKTANQIGVSIVPNVLVRADKVIK